MVDCTETTQPWGSRWPPSPARHREHGALVYSAFFKNKNKSIAASSPHGFLCLCLGGYKRDPGAEAAAQGKAGPGCGSPALLGLRAGSCILGNPSGLFNKGQSWILALACLPCPEQWAWHLSAQSHWEGKLAGHGAPARATPNTR